MSKHKHSIKNLDAQYLEKIKKVEFTPIFILGLHRSGTSILYKMLTETQEFNPVTAYHIINYDQLLYNSIKNKENKAKKELTKYLQSQGQKNRVIDKLKITADFAEEYGFLLRKYSSKYYITKNNVAKFIELGKKIQFISKNNKPLLLKNPYDLPNFPYIKSTFPTAKFIFIHRHPYRSISSLVKAVKLILKTRNSYTSLLFRDYNTAFENPLLLHSYRLAFSKYLPFGTILLSNMAARNLKKYMKNINQIPKKDYINLTYETLCEKPQETMQNILEFLEIKNIRIDFSTYIKPRKIRTDQSVINIKSFIYKNSKSYFNLFNYDKDFFL